MEGASGGKTGVPKALGGDGTWGRGERARQDLTRCQALEGLCSGAVSPR